MVDPNVLISSRISDLGHPTRITRAADEGRFELVLSDRLLGELSEVLMRPGLARRELRSTYSPSTGTILRRHRIH